MNLARTIWTFVTPLIMIAVQVAEVEARDENSFRNTHLLFAPVDLQSGQDLKICITDSARMTARNQSAYQPDDLVAEINLYDAIKPTTKWFNTSKGYMDGRVTCFDGTDLELPGDSMPETILAELILSAPAEHQSVPLATLELRDVASDTTSALLLPAVQADAPVTRGRIAGYRPQFYHRTTDFGTLTHVFGPFTQNAFQDVDICAADAGSVIDGMVPASFSEVVWTVEVRATHRKGQAVLDDIQLTRQLDKSSPCTGPITLADILPDQDFDPAAPASIDVVILLYAEVPAGTHVVPVATGRLKPIIVDETESEPIALLLPAVQTARDVAR
jgi:hypothetical protein